MGTCARGCLNRGTCARGCNWPLGTCARGCNWPLGTCDRGCTCTYVAETLSLRLSDCTYVSETLSHTSVKSLSQLSLPRVSVTPHSGLAMPSRLSVTPHPGLAIPSRLSVTPYPGLAIPSRLSVTPHPGLPMPPSRTCGGGRHVRLGQGRRRGRALADPLLHLDRQAHRQT